MRRFSPFRFFTDPAAAAALVVLTTDNGGPAYWTTPDVAKNYPPLVPGAKTGYAHGGGANNWPLKGSKISNWEGGTRGVSFVSGGFLPTEMRGKISMDMVHVTDWCKVVMLPRFVALSRLANPESITIADSTFCYLAGVDPEDPNTVGTYSDGKSRTII